MDILPTIRSYYDRGGERDRLRSGRGLLELLRTRDVLRRVLPPAPAAVLDVGGGFGVHAAWLAADGHRVRVIDPVPLHVAASAALPGVTAARGDARQLPEPDAGYDAVLLLGPLYHLLERGDRVAALREAARVVRPGGTVVAATIGRVAGLYDLLHNGRYADPQVRPTADATLRAGSHRPRVEGLFTDAYFHHPDEVPAEFADAGLPGAARYGLEGAVWLFTDPDDPLDSPVAAARLDALRATEQEESVLGISSHLLTVATRP